MKATTLLLWICRENATGEDMLMVDVPEVGEKESEQNESWWNNQFGLVPKKMAPAGKYMAISETKYFNNKDSYVYDEDYNKIEPDVELTFDDGGHHQWLYRLED